jgi:hypothetical protein
MSKSDRQTERKVRPAPAAKQMYRGIELVRLTAPTCIPQVDLERAVAEAFAKRSATVAKD